MKKAYYLIIFILTLASTQVQAQTYTLLIKGGHVIDPKNNIDAVMDIAITGDTIVRVAKNITENAQNVINAEGLYVTPGLIDIHSHNFQGTEPDHYLSNGVVALSPDGFTFRCGITTVVDAGGAGWKSFPTFKQNIIDNSKTRVLSLLNIVGEGMRGGAYEQDLEDMNAKMTAMVAAANPEVVGIKVAHYFGPEWDPVDRAVEAGNIAKIPVMIDFGGVEPPLSLEDLLLKHLRPGDIFTHCFAHVNGRVPIVDEQGKVRPYVLEAQQKGVIFDVGHGGGSFLFRQAVPATKSGFYPNTISTDLHTGSMNAGMKDLLNVMSKFINLNMDLPAVIRASTWKPAQVIQREELGHLSEGAMADIAILNLKEGEFGFIDSGGFRMDGNKKMECELTIRAGDVVYDLNGISRPLWTTKAGTTNSGH